MSNTSDFQTKLGSVVGNDIGGEATATVLFEEVVTFRKAADDSMAADVTANTKFWTNPFTFALRVVGAKYNADGTITAHDTNFATLQVKTDDGAASSPAVAAALATTTTDSGNVAAGISETFTLTAANVNVPAGGNLWFAIAKAAAGVVVRAGNITVRLQKL